MHIIHSNTRDVRALFSCCCCRESRNNLLKMYLVEIYDILKAENVISKEFSGLIFGHNVFHNCVVFYGCEF